MKKRNNRIQALTTKDSKRSDDINFDNNEKWQRKKDERENKAK